MPFCPAPDLGAWAKATFLDDDGPLYNPRHGHLSSVSIGWLWAYVPAMNRNLAIMGECRMVPPVQQKWSSQLTLFHLEKLFGHVPDFIITISALAADDMDEWSFCALIEHELCHIAQDVDAFGEPKFDRNGQPVLRLVGHDVEEFVDVVARYGAGATGVAEMVRVANMGPSIGQRQIELACGNCAARRAAA